MYTPERWPELTAVVYGTGQGRPDVVSGGTYHPQ